MRRFREAFGRRLDTFPMVRAQLDAMRRAARRTTAAGFAIYRAFDAGGGLDARRDADLAARRRALDVRELIMLQKFVAAEESTDVIRQAMSILGGNGVIEDFSCLPRLYRDSAVNELWEGPRNVLLAQIHRDLCAGVVVVPAVRVRAQRPRGRRRGDRGRACRGVRRAGRLSRSVRPERARGRRVRALGTRVPRPHARLPGRRAGRGRLARLIALQCRSRPLPR